MTLRAPDPGPSMVERETMLRALRASEERLHTVVSSAALVLWALDRDGIFTFSDGKGLELLGLRPGEVVGRSVFEVYADFPQVLADARRALSGEEFTTTLAVGESVFESRYTALRDESGELAGVTGVAVDVTDRVRAAEERERSLSLLRATLESTADGILVVDAAGRIVSFNRKFAEMWQLDPETLSFGQDEKAIAAVASQLKDPDGFVRRIQELYADPAVESSDTVEFLDGRVFERYSQPQRIGGQIVGRVWSFRDVTARRASERALLDRERQLAATQTLAGLGSWKWEVGTDTVVWSEELYRIFGEDPEHFRPSFSAYFERLHPDDRERVSTTIRDTMARGGRFELDERIVALDGGVRVLRTIGETLHDGAGAVVGMVGACQDITERKLAVETIRESQRRSEKMADRMHAVAAAAAGVLGADSLEGLQDVLRTACRSVIAFDAFTFALYHQEDHTLTLLSAYDTDILVPGNTMSASGVPMERVIQERKSLVTLHASDPAAAGSKTMGTGRRSESIIRSPILGPDRVLGVMSVQSYIPEAYTDEDVTVLETIASLAATAVEKIRLESERREVEEEAERVLRSSHQELEQRVEERTAELAETNMALEEEIGERERAEEELRQKTSELEAVFRALPDLYFRLDAEGTVLDFASGQTSTLLRESGDLVGRRIEKVLPPQVAARVQAGMRQVALTGTLVCVEFALPYEDGDRELEARLVPFLDDQVITVVRDVTDQKSAERALQGSEEHFRRLIENSSDIATIVDLEGINRYQSPSIQHILGYNPDEIVGSSALDRIHPEDVPACREILKWMAEHPGVIRGAEFRYRHKNGGWRVLEARGRTLLPDSAAAGVVINSRDVTERKEAQVVLERARQAAERANRAKSEFLSRMSHELRTPMNSILGFAQLLGRKEIAPDQRKAVDHIIKAGQHLLNLINEILDISRIEANRHQLSLEPVRLSNVVCEGVTLLQPLAAQRSIRIDECNIDPELFVYADRQRLAQVVLNLLSNAVKYNRHGGQVLLICEATDERVRLGVKDTGPGIPPERMDQLFMPFERLGAEQTGVEGTGLGLALSRRLVEAMEGTLTVETVPGEGSTFWVDLIRQSDPMEVVVKLGAGEGGADSGRAPGRRATIVYVEDNLANLALIETILLDRPEVTLIPALQGMIGIDLACEHRPDLILLDLHLPDMPGDEVLRRLRAHPRTRDVPVVIISADATPRRSEGLIRDGASAYLTKPLNVDEFLGTIDRLLREKEN